METLPQKFWEVLDLCGIFLSKAKKNVLAILAARVKQVLLINKHGSFIYWFILFLLLKLYWSAQDQIIMVAADRLQKISQTPFAILFNKQICGSVVGSIWRQGALISCVEKNGHIMASTYVCSATFYCCTLRKISTGTKPLYLQNVVLYVEGHFFSCLEHPISSRIYLCIVTCTCQEVL